ncbi:hypothetical protein [Microbacterium timonense]|uniref:hypothetical protein n=1 Tax=Microbacterium timonense TaxID=2086576 RepID=UPI000D105E96|nr:hypothetical protein [Microbacterium timonense]
MALRMPFAAVLTALMFLVPPAPAVADEPRPAEVCTAGAAAVPLGQDPPTDLPLVMSCFDSEAEALAFIRAGAPGDFEQLAPEAAARDAVATVMLGKSWTGLARGGAQLIHWGTGSGCFGVTYGFPTLASGWNNTIRSAEGFSNCWASHYDGSSYSGAVLTCAPYCSSLGALDAKTSSIVYRPTGTFG